MCYTCMKLAKIKEYLDHYHIEILMGSCFAILFGTAIILMLEDLI